MHGKDRNWDKNVLRVIAAAEYFLRKAVKQRCCRKIWATFPDNNVGLTIYVLHKTNVYENPSRIKNVCRQNMTSVCKLKKV